MSGELIPNQQLRFYADFHGYFVGWAVSVRVIRENPWLEIAILLTAHRSLLIILWPVSSLSLATPAGRGDRPVHTLSRAG